MGEGEREGWWGREGGSEGREGGNQGGRDWWVEGDIAAGPKSSRVSMLASLRACELATWRQYLNKFDRQLFAPWPRQNFVGWLSCVRLVHADALVLHPSDTDEAPRRQADSEVLHKPFKKASLLSAPAMRTACASAEKAELHWRSAATSRIFVGESLQRLSRRQSALRAAFMLG